MFPTNNHAYMCLGVLVCVCLRIYIRIHSYTYRCFLLIIYIYVFIHLFVYLFIYLLIYLFVHSFVYLYKRITYIYIYADILWMVVKTINRAVVQEPWCLNPQSYFGWTESFTT